MLQRTSVSASIVLFAWGSNSASQDVLLTPAMLQISVSIGVPEKELTVSTGGYLLAWPSVVMGPEMAVMIRHNNKKCTWFRYIHDTPGRRLAYVSPSEEVEIRNICVWKPCEE